MLKKIKIYRVFSKNRENRKLIQHFNNDISRKFHT